MDRARLQRSALIIAGIYAGVAGVWILLTGWLFQGTARLLGLDVADPDLRVYFEYGKGLFFVLVTAVLLWLLIRRALRREQAIAAEREAAVARLAQNEHLAMLGLLASSVAHEFNNLHTVIQGNLELAISNQSDEDGLRQRLERSRAALTRASGLTHAMLRFARPGRAEMAPVRVDRIAAETIDLVRRALEAEGVAIEQDLQPVPEVPGDQHQLGQALMNLVINAHHAMRGATRKQVRIATCVQDGVRITVSDTGCGMTKEVQQRIFAPFFTTKREEGTGLGLYFTSTTVEAHGGRITCDSSPGQGTTFVITLPVAVGSPRNPKSETRNP